MEIKPGLYRFKNKEDWDYVVDNIDFNNCDYSGKERIKNYWNDYKSDFAADIKLCNGRYNMSYATKKWWKQHYPEKQITDYISNPYSVELL